MSNGSGARPANTRALIWALIRFRPGLYFLGAALFLPYDALPPLTGLAIRAIFDRLSGAAPAGFDVWHYPSDRELNLTWTQSTDNVDAPQAIRYEITINGTLAESVIGTGFTISYGEFGDNVISLVAIDSAGNRSGSVVITTEI